MIVSLLKKNTSTGVALIVLTGFLLWTGAFSFSNDAVSSTTPTFFSNIPYRINAFFNLIIILFGAFLASIFFTNQEISFKSNYISGFLYVILAFSAINNNHLNIGLLSNIFIILSIYLLIKTYRQEAVFSDIFKSGLCIGLACFLYLQYLVLLPIVITSLLILRPFNWREWAILVIGFFVPSYIYFSISYLSNNNASIIFSNLAQIFSQIKPPLINSYQVPLLLLLVLLLSLFSLTNAGKGFGNTIKAQKIKQILFWLVFFCLPFIFLNSDSKTLMIPFTFPLSILLGGYISSLVKTSIANLTLYLILGCVCISYFHSLTWI